MIEDVGLVDFEGTLTEIMDAAEKQVLEKALQKTGGNKTMAARELGIAIRSLYYKLEKHGIG